MLEPAHRRVRQELKPGQVATFQTRSDGQTTTLFLKAGELEARASWRIELWKKPMNKVVVAPKEQIKIDIPSVAGALVDVRNDGWTSFTTWTDYEYGQQAVK